VVRSVRCGRLLAFAKPGHLTFGSDFPYAPTAAGKLFAAGLETYPGIDAGARAAIERTNALALFPRLAAAPQPIPQSTAQQIRRVVSRSVIRGITRLTNIR
jgi:6-methylsalicylate decarboxylase